MTSLLRLKALYQPRGRAREYSDWALNLYSGCCHGCRYCFGPAVTHKTREQFSHPQPRVGILAKLEHDLNAMAVYCASRMQEPSPAAGLPKHVHLCFTCDPYQADEEDFELTRGAITLLHDADIGVQILTKSGELCQRDFGHDARVHLGGHPHDSFGVTLTFADEVAARSWEPNADPPYARMAALKQARKLGIRTWCSLEPVIDPEETLRIIDLTHDYVGFYRVGPLNYLPEITAGIDWRTFAERVVVRFQEYDCRYELKQALRSLLPADSASTSTFASSS